MSQPSNGLKDSQINMRVSQFDKYEMEQLAVKVHEEGLIKKPKVSKLILFLIKKYKGDFS